MNAHDELSAVQDAKQPAPPVAPTTAPSEASSARSDTPANSAPSDTDVSVDEGLVELQEGWRTTREDEPPSGTPSDPDDPPQAEGAGTPPVVPSPNERPAVPDEDPEKPMTLLDHLGELRVRLVRSLIAACVGFALCWNVAKLLFNYLAMPLVQAMPADAKLIYLGVAEAFFVELKVALLAGVFVASPYIFHQIWAFIAPGLYDEEKRHVLPLALCSAVFFLGGAAFCYFVVFPFAFSFFMSYSTGNVVAMPSMGEYFGFTLKLLLAFGLIFEMPLFAFFLARMGLVTAERMRKIRRYAVLAVFAAAAILTPPDVFSQLLMAAPMLVLYEVSILVAAAVGRRKSKPEPPSAAGASA